MKGGHGAVGVLRSKASGRGPQRSCGRCMSSSFLIMVFVSSCRLASCHEAGFLGPVDPEALYTLPEISLEALQRPLTSANRKRLRQAVQETGLLVVRQIPGYLPARRAILRKIAVCSELSSGAANAHEVTLADGTVRRTFATTTTAGRPQPLVLPSACIASGEEDPSLTLRELVDQVAHDFANRFDDLVNGAAEPARDSFTRSCSTTYSEFSKVAAASQQLEHFHVYIAKGNTTIAHEERTSGGTMQGGVGSPPSPTLDLHTDSGAFLAMAPPLYLEIPGFAPAPYRPEVNGLTVKLRSGRQVQPAVPEDSLLFMLGEAAKTWLNPPCLDLYVPAHAMALPPGRLARAWYGRMFFPLESFRRGESGQAESNRSMAGEERVTWGEYTTAARLSIQGPGVTLPSHMEALSCAPGFKLSEPSQCADGEMYCWLQCMPIKDKSCAPSKLLCESASDHHIWDKKSHCMDCAPTCPVLPDSPPAPPLEGWCNKAIAGLDMYMGGFVSARSTRSSDPCAVVLFKEWKLTTKAKLAGACIGTLLLGVLVEFIVVLRRRMLSVSMGFWSRRTMSTFLFALQVALGYFLMLIAMSYQVELFCMVVLGLALGHALFNTAAPVREGDQCCPEEDGGYKLMLTDPHSSAEYS